MVRACWVVVAWLSVVGGCSLALSPGEEQCETADDCAARGFGEATCEQGLCVEPVVIDPIWGCLGNVVEPEPDPTQVVLIEFRLVFASDGNPVADGTVVDVCDNLDPECTNTASPDFPKGLSVNADGTIALEAKQGFDGFIRISNPDIVPSRVYVGRPILEPPSVKEIRLLRPLEYETLANIALAEVDPMRGTAIVLGLDCQDDGVSGLRFESASADAGTKPFYLINQSPQTPPTATETDVDGFGGFFNMPAGNAVVVSRRAEGDLYVGESSLQILANTISYVQVKPTPE